MHVCRRYSTQMSMGLNVIVAMATAFTSGYFVAGLYGSSAQPCQTPTPKRVRCSKFPVLAQACLGVWGAWARVNIARVRACAHSERFTPHVHCRRSQHRDGPPHPAPRARSRAHEHHTTHHTSARATAERGADVIVVRAFHLTPRAFCARLHLLLGAGVAAAALLLLLSVTGVVVLLLGVRRG